MLCHEDEVIHYFDVIPPYGIETQYFSPDLASVGHIRLAGIFLIVIIYKTRSTHIAYKFWWNGPGRKLGDREKY